MINIRGQKLMEALSENKLLLPIMLVCLGLFIYTDIKYKDW